MNKQDIIREHYSKMAKKAHIAIKAKYGNAYYSRIKKAYWDKRKAGESNTEAEKIPEVGFGLATDSDSIPDSGENPQEEQK